MKSFLVLFIVCELSEIRDLFDAKQQMTSSGHRIQDHFSELEARRIIHSITKRLIHLHVIGIAHGDIKPENILIFRNMSPEKLSVHGIVRFDKFCLNFSNS
jgi:serine/threonine protein kinase